MVLLRAVAVLDPRLARADPRPEIFLPHHGDGDRVRHPLLLGGADDHVRARVHGRSPLPDRLPARAGARRAGAQDVEIDRQRDGSALGDGRRDRRANPRRRHKRGDRRKIPAGHPRDGNRRAALHADHLRLAGQRPQPEHRAGGGQPQLRQQAVERRPLHPRRVREARPGMREGAADSGRPLDPRATRADGRSRNPPDEHLPVRRSRTDRVRFLLERIRGLVHRAFQTADFRKPRARPRDGPGARARVRRLPAPASPLYAVRHRSAVGLPQGCLPRGGRGFHPARRLARSADHRPLARAGRSGRRRSPARLCHLPEGRGGNPHLPGG